MKTEGQIREAIYLANWRRSDYAQANGYGIIRNERCKRHSDGTKEISFETYMIDEEMQADMFEEGCYSITIIGEWYHVHIFCIPESYQDWERWC